MYYPGPRGMQVAVRSVSGNCHLCVDADEGAESIRAKIHDKLGVPPYQQQLLASVAGISQLLQAGTSLRNLGMVGRGMVLIDVQRVNVSGVQILVRKLDGGSFYVYPSSNCSVLHLKRMISDLVSTLPDHQRLIYAGTKLEDSKTLAEHRIVTNGCTIDLISVLCSRFGCSVCKGSEIDLKLPNGKIFTMAVKDSDVVEKLKLKVFQEGSVPVDHQALFVGNRKLENGHSIGEYLPEISKNVAAPIVVSLSYVTQVLVRLPNSRELPLEVDIYDRAGSLKTQIQQLSGIPPDKVSLSVSGSGQVIEDSRQLCEYGIQDNPVLMLSLTVIVVVIKSLAGRTFEVEVNSRGTVLHLKEAIHKIQGTPTSLQRLFYTGKHLQDWMCLPTCKIVHKSTVHVVFQSSGAVTIAVKDLTGRLFRLRVDSRDTIQALKEMVHKLQQIPPEEQRLVLDGQLLEDHFAICDYGIQSGAIVHVIPRAGNLLQLTVMTLSQRVLTIESMSDTPIRVVKGMIEKKLGHATWNELYLFFAGRELENSRTLSDYKITNRSTLLVISPETSQ